MELINTHVSINYDCLAHFIGNKKKMRVKSLSFLERDTTTSIPLTEWLIIQLADIKAKKEDHIDDSFLRIILFSEEINMVFGTNAPSKVKATNFNGEQRDILFIKDKSGSVCEIHIHQQ